MTAPLSVLAPVSFSSYFDPTMGAVQQVAIYFYRASTLDPITVYTDALLSIPHPVPVLSSGFGQVPPVWIGTIADPGYRMRVFNQYSELVQDVDNLPGPVAPAGGSGGGGTINPGDVHLLTTGDIVPAFSNATPRPGGVLCNGTTLGKPGSPANGYSNTDGHNLFLWLWGQDVYGVLPVSPSRGATAQGDWDGLKTIQIPDLRCRAIMGMDGMGSTITNRLAGVAFAAGSAEKCGAYGGAATGVLTPAMLPTHNHVLTDPQHTHPGTVPAHGHTASGYSDSIGAHQHSVQTYGQSANHSHTVPSGGGSSTAGVGSASTFATMAGGTSGPASNDHTHTGYTIADGTGQHQHNLTINVAQQPAMTVTNSNAPTGITIAPFGSATPTAFPVAQPSIALCFFMIL